MTGIQISASLTGLKELDRELAQLESKVQRKMAARATRDTTKFILADAKAHSPVDEGDLVRSLKVRAATLSRGRRLPRDMVGHQVISDKKRFPRAYYASFVFLGSKFQEGQDTLRESLYANSNTAIQLFRKHMASGIREISRESKAK
jgi:HK97 gp10 family phage protein